MELAPETKVVVKEYMVDQHTGRIEIVVASETTDGGNTWKGPEKHYSIDPQALRDRFGGDIDQWEAWVASEHRPLIGHHPDLPAQLAERRGKVIG